MCGILLAEQSQSGAPSLGDQGCDSGNKLIYEVLIREDLRMINPQFSEDSSVSLVETWASGEAV